MFVSPPGCPTCGFENPRAWRVCAACGEALGQGDRHSTATSGLKQGPDETIQTLASNAETLEAPAERDTVVGPLPKEPTVEPEVSEVFEAEALPPLVGQDQACEVIRDNIEQSWRLGLPALTVLTGARGSGKSRLLGHASEVAARFGGSPRVLYGAVREGGSDGPYAPFSRILLERFGVTPASQLPAVRDRMQAVVSESLVGRDPTAIAETTHLLGHVAGIPFPESPFLEPIEAHPIELGRSAVAAVKRLLEADARARPLLLLLDDMHHAGDLAWQLVTELLSSESAIAIVITGDDSVRDRRTIVPANRVVSFASIKPLIESDVTGLLHVLFPQLVAAPEPFVAALLHRSNGNPGALRELLRMLTESDLFVETPAGVEVDMHKLEQGDLPVTIEDAIMARLDRLDALERATIERAAIVGEVFWDGAVLSQMRSERPLPGSDLDPLSIWPDDDDAEALGRALRRLEDKGFIYSHEHSDLVSARELSFQLGKTRTVLLGTIDASMLVHRHAAVARWLAAVADLRREGIAAMIAPHLEQAGLAARAGRAYHEAAVYEASKLHTATALLYIEKALPLIAPDDVVRKLDALHEHGSLLTTIGRYDEAKRSFTDLLKAAWRLGARGKAGAALNRIARVHRQQGEDVRATALFERALELFRAAGDLRGVASTLDDLAQMYRLRGDQEAALRAATEALEIRRAHGDSRGEALSLATLGSIELALGEFALAEKYLYRALEIRQVVGDHPGVVQTHNMLGNLAFERGDSEAAIAAWDTALGRARDMADRRTECFVLNNLGEAHLSLGRPDEARASLLAARTLAATLSDRRALAEIERNLGLTELKNGEILAARKTLAHALGLAEDYGAKEAIALAHRALGQLQAQTLFDADASIDRTAEECFLSSIDLFREIGNDKEAARSLAELGYHLIERGEPEGAKERLHEARALMRRIGLAELGRVEDTLKQLGS